MAVTGVGLVSPLGATAAEHWRNLIDGRRGGRWLPELGRLQQARGTPGDWQRWSGAPARGELVVPPPGILSRLALRAAAEALESAGAAAIESVDPVRRGCVVGVSKPVLTGCGSELADDLLTIHAASAAIAAQHRITGPVLVPSAACATGLVSLIRGVQLIRDGSCDVVLAGSTDWSLRPEYLAGYRRMGVLAKSGDDPSVACRPYDRRRSGFVVGSGAAMLVLEEWQHARDRGARILVEWQGSALAGDASSMVDVDAEGETAARVIRDALRRSHRCEDVVDAASLHGTGTMANDLAESRALRKTFGERAAAISCFSLKGSIGHLMGAAGSVETATLILAMNAGLVPATVNLEQPDPDCGLDFTPGEPRARPIRAALKLSLGFGGACAAALLTRPEAS